MEKETPELTQTHAKPEVVSAEPAVVSGDDPMEPQNTLTEQFTEAEWTALKEFRERIPDILSESYKDKPKDRDLSANLWGVVIDPARPADARVSVVLMKFLRARNLDLGQAHTMMVQTLRWREEFNVEAAVKEEFPQDVFGQLGRVYGRDKEGRPVIYNLYGANKAAFSDVERFLRWRVALMEKSLGQLDFEKVDQTVQIHDYEGVSLRSRDANSKAAATRATEIFQNYYPELLARKFFINVPSFFSWMFWLFKPFLSANTIAKMTVVGSGQQAIKTTLLSIIDVKELPIRYGGDSTGFD